MEPNCQNQPCRELTELQKRFTRFQDDTVKRLAAGDVSMATINTKLNWLIGILSGIYDISICFSQFFCRCFFEKINIV